MKNKFTRRQALALGGMAGVAPFMPRMAFAQDKAVGLPDTMIWTAYDVGSTGYNEASAIADALMKAYGTRIRLLPSGTSVGRITPLEAERAQYGWLATETFFAVEGLYDFAAKDQGPQDVRVLLGRPASFGIVVTGESGIKKMEDLKGKRLAWVPANTSVNVKVLAMLAFAGMTLDDVELVTLPSYGASLRALVDGTADAAGTSPTAATLRELEASPRGIGWVPVPAGNKEGWERLTGVAPFFSPHEETIGAGMSKDNPVELMAYKYPMIVTYASTDEDQVYALTKAVDETFDLYKESSPVMALWAIEKSGKPPADAPFHEGAVRYLKEKGLWTDESEAWQKQRLDHVSKVKGAWKDTLAAAEKEGIADDKFADFWLKRREQALAK